MRTIMDADSTPSGVVRIAPLHLREQHASTQP